MDEYDPNEPTPPQALRMSRVLWVGLMIPQVMFGIVVISLARKGQLSPTANLYPLLLYVSIGSLIVLTAVAYFVRNQIYKSNWQGDVVTPRGYVVANVILMVILEATSIIALIAAIVTGHAVPLLVVAGLSLLVQIVNFPTGSPMRPHGPRVGKAAQDQTARKDHNSHSTDS